MYVCRLKVITIFWCDLMPCWCTVALLLCLLLAMLLLLFSFVRPSVRSSIRSSCVCTTATSHFNFISLVLNVYIYLLCFFFFFYFFLSSFRFHMVIFVCKLFFVTVPSVSFPLFASSSISWPDTPHFVFMNTVNLIT